MTFLALYLLSWSTTVKSISRLGRANAYSEMRRTSWTESRTISAGDNAIPDIAYSDLGGSFDINAFGHSETLFFSVTNLFNQKPPTSPPQTTTFSRGANTAYDPVGRYFTAGLRFRY